MLFEKIANLKYNLIFKSAILIRSTYVILGLAVGFFLSANIYSSEMYNKEKEIVYFSALSSCYFGVYKLTPTADGSFCEEYAIKSSQNYKDISEQMDFIIDRMSEQKNQTKEISPIIL